LSSQLHGKYKQEDGGPGWLGINVRSYPKNNQSEKYWGVIQVVEHIPSKHKALSLNTSTTKVINKQK
jgi:hypothetical protein